MLTGARPGNAHGRVYGRARERAGNGARCMHPRARIAEAADNKHTHACNFQHELDRYSYSYVDQRTTAYVYTSLIKVS